MMAVLAAPVFLGTQLPSMNSFEPCFWLGALLVVLRWLMALPTPHWLVFGCWPVGHRKQALDGFLFGGAFARPHSQPAAAHPLVALVRSRSGRVVAAGIAQFTLAMGQPLPTYELLNGVAHSDKNIKLSPLAFLREQVNMLLIVAARCGSAAWRGWPLPATHAVALRRLYLSAVSGHDDGHARQDYYVAPSIRRS